MALPVHKTPQETVFGMDDMVIHMYGFLLGNDMIQIIMEKIDLRLVSSTFNRCFVPYLNSAHIKLTKMLLPSRRRGQSKTCSLLQWLKKNEVTGLSILVLDIFFHEVDTLDECLEGFDLTNLRRLNVRIFFNLRRMNYKLESLLSKFSRSSLLTHLRFSEGGSYVLITKLLSYFPKLEYLQISGYEKASDILETVGELQYLEQLILEIYYLNYEEILLYSKSLKFVQFQYGGFLDIVSLDCPCLEFLVGSTPLIVCGIESSDLAVEFGRFGTEDFFYKCLESIPYRLHPTGAIENVISIASLPLKSIMDSDRVQVGENCRIFFIDHDDGSDFEEN